MGDSTKRSFVKTVCWRLTGSGATFLIAWLLSGNFAVASSIALLQMLVNTILYYVHERVWNSITWGRD